MDVLRTRIATEQNRRAGLFDAEWYLARNPDVAAKHYDPFAHYIKFGHKEGRNPGPNFDDARYVELYPDVIEAGLVPLIHYIDHGRAEGRALSADVLQAQRPAGTRHTLVKAITCKAGSDMAVLVTHTASGRLKPHVLAYMQLLAETGFSVLLVAVVDRPVELLDAEVAAAAGIIVRENAGYDFGAWAHALEIEPGLYGAGLLVITNDSVIPTADAEVFAAMIGRVRDNRADIVALTASHEYGWHVQSYFLAFKPKALASWTFQHWVRDIERLDDKDAVIRAYEVPFAARMQAGGLTVAALYAASVSANPTFFGWRELIDQGFPFIKLLMLRKNFAASVPDHLDLLAEIQADWPEVLGAAGFDVNLVRAAVRAAEISPPGVGDTRLLAHPERFEAIAAGHRLRVAFFGPWNYDNGLGAASRELIAALRRTGVRLNLYPIERPFHVHRLVCPAVPVCDFGGQADIAVVHLNPDSWHLLTPEQRALVDGARWRIGYWVWETDTLPPAWRHNLGAVDRIWSPSTYCAEVFAAQAQRPVDVVPHAVEAQAAGGRAAMLATFGIAPEQRVILYIFDGASYLVRKNPEALIRAFAATQLGARGWTLLLKTKHLFDRPEAGKALQTLAASVAGVVLAEANLSAREVSTLMAAADIYASPHSSEGFGLTVAEAMAAGKPVVATDFGGTRDFLDASCGYPVAWTPSVLDTDHGHYLKGHGWATIDEDALAAGLIRAAKAVDAGDHRIGRAARARIAQDLSYDAVARAIERSFAAVITQGTPSANAAATVTRPKPPVPAPEIAVSVSSGQRFAELEDEDGFIPVPLGDDLAWNGQPLPGSRDSDWLILAPGRAHSSPGLINFVRNATSQRPDAVLFYADDVAVGEDPLNRIRLKPDFNATLLVAQDYIGAPIIVRRAALTAVGGLDAAFGTAVLYHLLLRLAKAGRPITRIPQVLVGYEGLRPVATVADRLAALRAVGADRDGRLEPGLASGLLAMRWRFAEAAAPHISICIPTRRTRRPDGDGSYIEALLAAIARVEWPMRRLTVIVGDDITDSPAWGAQSWPFRLERIATPRAADEPFNYARKMNQLWRAATGEIVVLMNDDLAPEGTDWLAPLVGFAAQDDVGGVGARLIYEDGALQHAGIYPAFGTVVHAWLAMDPAAPTAHDWALAQREWSMVTGAVFAVRRAVLDQVGGFDEAFSLEFNDIDLCLRIRNLGYRIVYNPDAVFTHAEKASRGETLPPGAEVALFLTRWARWLTQDPASHPYFARDRVDLVPQLPTSNWCLARS